MSATTTVRLSSVKARRVGAPFVNFPSPSISHAHPDSRPRMWQDNQSDNGWGTRHVSDSAPFNLWSEQTHEFRFPSAEEMQWIRQTYGVKSIGHFGNFMVLETETPPEHLPLITAGVSIMFVPIGQPGEILYDPFTPHHNTNYASPQVKDPIITTVELEFDGRIYGRRSLPGIVAGCTTLYHHSADPYWGGMSKWTRWMVPNPATNIQDVTNYLTVGSRQLRPGVRVSSWYDISGQPQRSASTTAGVLLRNGPQMRMTCALHGWLNSNEVYHPQAPSGEMIGVIKERYDAQDIALVDLHPSIRFTNSSYFDAIPPRRLLTREDTRNTRGHWYLADSMSTGCVAMMQEGIIHKLPSRPSGHFEIPYTKWQRETSIYSKLYAMIGATGGDADVADGLCGAPIVEESANSQGIAGFFQLEDGQHYIAPCLDQLVADGWSLF